MEGLLWYKNDKTLTLEAKIAGAARRYQEKNGRPPNTCFINPANNERDEGEFAVEVDGVTIQVTTRPNVLLHHYWIGELEHA